MLYRDLVPGRMGGGLIASHIRIPEGGPVPDYVHFHEIRFQVIHCYRGWVRVVYEDQGEPFLLQAGDCVLQPPRIRHRVLECSAGLEVIEITSPADHVTRVDHDLTLPTPRLRPDREFRGQRFLRHVAADASWTDWRSEGFRARDTGIGAATGGLAGVSVVRPRETPLVSAPISSRAGGLLWFVLEGGFLMQTEGRMRERIVREDVVVVPPGMEAALEEWSPDLEFLEVALPVGPGNPYTT
jgi:quercetin dioxygenase-like cupin family protein